MMNFFQDPPSQPVLYECTNVSISLRWEEPEFDGGHRIIGYDIEKQTLPSKHWAKCNVGNISDTEFKVSCAALN